MDTKYYVLTSSQYSPSRRIIGPFPSDAAAMRYASEHKEFPDPQIIKGELPQT